MINEGRHNLLITRLRKELRIRFDKLFYRDSRYLERVDSLCSWVIMPGLMVPNGTVLSGGVGQDIGFEKKLAARYGCRVHLFDPSPTGLRTMSLPENKVPGIEFLPVGLAGSPGILEFSAPRDDAEGSFTVARSDFRPKIQLKCESIVSYMREHNLKECHLLKLDIEGFEYGVLDDILSANLIVPQICVEFHHFLPDIPIRRTVAQIVRLFRAGYRIAYKNQCDYLFVHRRFWPNSRQ